MRLLFLCLGFLAVADIAVAAHHPMEEYAAEIRAKAEASKDVRTGAFSPQINKKAEAPKQPQIQQPNKPQIPQPEKQIQKPSNPQPIKQPEPAKIHKPDSSRNQHVDNKPHHTPDKNPHHTPDKHPHHTSAKPARTTIVLTSSPVVSYTTVGNGVVYEANPHIYSASTYGCTMKGDLKYCTDSIGKPLTGRIVQNYSDSVAYETYKKGYLSGETSVYTPDGTLLQTTNYSKGLKHGKEKVYYGNGRIYYTANYNRGVLQGEVRQYSMSGEKIGQMYYNKGRYTSRYCRYDTANDLIRDRIRANEKNELILCNNN